MNTNKLPSKIAQTYARDELNRYGLIHKTNECVISAWRCANEVLNL